MELANDKREAHVAPDVREAQRPRRRRAHPRRQGRQGRPVHGRALRAVPERATRHGHDHARAVANDRSGRDVRERPHGEERRGRDPRTGEGSEAGSGEPRLDAELGREVLVPAAGSAAQLAERGGQRVDVALLLEAERPALRPNGVVGNPVERDDDASGFPFPQGRPWRRSSCARPCARRAAGTRRPPSRASAPSPRRPRPGSREAVGRDVRLPVPASGGPAQTSSTSTSEPHPATAAAARARSERTGAMRTAPL